MTTSLRPFREDERRGRGNLDALQFIEGVLATNLAAAFGAVGKNAHQSLTGRTTAILNVIEWDEDDTFYETGETATIVNRSSTFSAGVGTYLQAYRIGGEFRPLPTFQTVRGRVLKTIVTDDPINYPTYCLMEVLEPGINLALAEVLDSSPVYTITAMNSGSDTFTLNGNATSYATVGRYLRVTIGGATRNYTIASSAFAFGETTVTVSDSVIEVDLSESDTARIPGAIVIDGDQTDYVLVGDTLSLWDATGTFTALLVDLASDETTVTVTETITTASITDELAAVRLFSAATTTLVIDTDITPEAITGHYLQIDSAGASNGTYKIVRAIYFPSTKRTQVSVEENVPAGTITASSTVKIVRTVIPNTIRRTASLTFAIQSVTTGNPGSITISDPSVVLAPSDPCYDCDKFLEGHIVEITGSSLGVNDGTFRCRRDFTDNGSTITIHLDGVIATPVGALGSVTLKMPPQLVVKSKALAVLRWYGVSLQAFSLVHTLMPDGEGWHEIIASDYGVPYYPLD